MKETVEILLVDDDEAVRGLARVILQHEGWQVAEAGSLLEATDKLREGDFRPQVAVVDLLLPDGLGTDLTQELHRVRRKSKVVYITGDPGWLRRLNSGSESVLAKPFTPVQLVVAVRAALETMKPVVVFVEPGRVYQRLITSALEHSGVEIIMASSFEEGLLLAGKREAAVLFAPSPGDEAALAGILDLAQRLPALEVVAIDVDPSKYSKKWYDRRLLKSYSVQEVVDTVRHAFGRRDNPVTAPSKWSEVHQDGNG